jgi:hypothetical protein
VPLPQVVNAQYTALSTAGTTTLNAGQAGGGPPSSSGVLYGASVVSAGTGFAVTIVDIINPTGSGTNTATITNTLMNGTGSAGQMLPAGIYSVGVRYRGALVAVTAGTPGQINVLWD